MKEKWIVTNKKTAFENLSKEMSLSPILLRLLANRGITTKKQAEEFLYGDIDKLVDPYLMKDMNVAVSIIKEAILQNKKIVIYGDYDCDGVCSTAILYKTFKILNAKFDYYIPNRESEGYGMNSHRLEILKDEGAEVIITCDNGISAYEEVKYAKELGMTVVVTDHHDIPERIPLADCVVNPKQEDCKYPFKKLCGAGVALKFSKAILENFNVKNMDYSELIQFAALATVCDVVDLLEENRIIVKTGLELINKTANCGLKALIKANNLEDKTISEYHLGFVFGPCINATGRLETADISLQLLVCEDPNEAFELAKKLVELNNERQEITFEGLERILKNISIKDDEKVIVVFDPELHESIAGIVAGRIREKYNLPTIVMTKAKDGLKGSGRSIEGYNMFEELTKCKEYLEKFGGHPMAAGLSIKEENFNLLRKALNDNCSLTDEDVLPVVRIDSPLNLETLSEELINDLNKMKPVGKCNPSPLFAAKKLEVLRTYFIGKEKNILKFRIKMNNGMQIDAINFDKFDMFKEEFIGMYGEEEFLKLQDDGYSNFKLGITYYPDINEYNGVRNIQLVIKNLRIEK